MTDKFMLNLSILPTCDASGTYPVNRATDLDAYILESRVYRLATAAKFKDPLLLVWRAHQNANI